MFSRTIWVGFCAQTGALTGASGIKTPVNLRAKGLLFIKRLFPTPDYCVLARRVIKRIPLASGTGGWGWGKRSGQAFWKFDQYTFAARIAPVLFTVLPTIFVAGLWMAAPFGRPLNYLVLASISCALVFVAQFGRHRGKAKQKELWDSWGGPPTTRFLRHSNTEFNPVRRNRCHKNLQKMLPDEPLPTAEVEKYTPQLADQMYEACVDYLIGQTRNRRLHPLIHQENINYGFLRNLWGLRPYGLFLSALGWLASIIYSLYQWYMYSAISHRSLYVMIFYLMLLCLWLFWVNPGKVKVAAEAYAERLLEYCEQWRG